MLIAGIPDEHIERLHWNLGGGRGALGYRHRPSGIEVSRECRPGVAVLEIDQEVLADFKKTLKSAGIITDENT